MPAYRVYHVDHHNRLSVGDLIEADDDHAAVAAFERSHRLGRASELWRGGAMVAKISPAGRLTLKNA